MDSAMPSDVERRASFPDHPAQYPMTPARWHQKEAKRLKTVLAVETGLLVAMGLVVLLLLASLAGSYIAAPSSRVRVDVVRSGDPLASVAVVPVSGILYCGATGGASRGGPADWIVEALSAAASDERVRAVVLEVDSPGGSIAGSDLVHREIGRVRSSGRKVVAFLGTLAASGGYYVASGADKIVALPTSVTGSIGVILQTFRVEGLFAKLGVEAVTVKTGKHKDMGSPFRELSDDERRMLQAMANEAHERFVTVVSNGRGLPREKVAGLADGRVFTATQAKDAGLVDELGYLDDAIALAEGLAGVSGATVVRYRSNPSLMDLFMMRACAADVARELTRPGLAYLAEGAPAPLYLPAWGAPFIWQPDR